MLDSVTKKRIDDLRNILVGKIPSPQSQVEQITTGLIYKFMYDMDEEAVEMGGVPSFFVDDYEKYSWKHLFDPKLGGADKVQLYSDAIENMYTNPSAPQLFREIFKNSFLPFKDPSTLNMFLKEINEFHYSHSEKLGDAFEYLLSFMGSQGDAGQFRTPRHIIDFIVEIVNPQKNETILDPACGTAGFLISSYKHILSQNTDKKLGDKLNASERKQVGDNLVGYDISPDMTRISLVNMYLHQFASPQIHEYDTLSSEDRWNEYYDVILANPPFFSPTGGIQPHSRFGVQSTRAEVLFVDYIMEHLKPTGRAGIVVPEGIIFQTGSAYKTLRKKLVEDCLVGVISLPAGVFQPYSGVKTSILILDKELNQKSDSILFAKVENDGFSLGSQRTPISKNDLPNIISCIKNSETDDKIQIVNKEEILHSSDVNLGGKKKVEVQNFSDFEFVELDKLITIQNGFAFKSKLFNESEGKPLIRIRDIKTNSTKTYYNGDYSDEFLVENGDLLVGMDGEFNVCIWSGGQALLNQRVCKLISNENILPNYLYRMIQKPLKEIEEDTFAVTVKHISGKQINAIQIPLPPIEVQQQIVNELEGYQKIIDGCRQVVENYKPTIDIDPSWEMMELKDIIKLSSGQGLTQKDFKEGEYEVYGGNGVTGYHNKYLLSDRTVVIGRVGAYCGSVHLTSEKCWITDNGLFVKELLQPVNLEYLALVLKNLNLNQYAKVGGQPSISQGEVLRLSIPFPKMETQNELVMKANHISDLVQQNNELIKIYTQKIQDRISKVWGD